MSAAGERKEHKFQDASVLMILDQGAKEDF